MSIASVSSVSAASPAPPTPTVVQQSNPADVARASSSTHDVKHEGGQHKTEAAAPAAATSSAAQSALATLQLGG